MLLRLSSMRPGINRRQDPCTPCSFQHTLPEHPGLPAKVNTLSQLVTERIRHQEMNGPLSVFTPPPSALSCPGPGRGSFSPDWGGRGLLLWTISMARHLFFPRLLRLRFVFFSFLLCSVPVLIIHPYLPDCPQVSLLTFPNPNPVP